MPLRIAAALLLVAMVPAHADLITFDPNDYAPGTNISHAQPGVSVAHVAWPNGYEPHSPIPPTRTFDVVATRCSDVYYSCVSEDGLGFGMSAILEEYASCAHGYRCTPYARGYLEFTFDDPTDYIAFNMSWSRDGAGLFAYNSAGTLIYSCQSPYCVSQNSTNPYEEGYVSTVTLSRSERDIQRIVVGSYSGSGFVNSLQYSVPEPSTMALMSLGLMGLGLRRKRSAITAPSG